MEWKTVGYFYTKKYIMKQTRESCGSFLILDVFDSHVDQADFDICFCFASEFEQKYSRFIK